MIKSGIWEMCPECQAEIPIRRGTIEPLYVGDYVDNQTIRVDVDAYCENCDNTYYGAYDFDLRAGNFHWLTFKEYFS